MIKLSYSRWNHVLDILKKITGWALLNWIVFSLRSSLTPLGPINLTFEEIFWTKKWQIISYRSTQGLSKEANHLGLHRCSSHLEEKRLEITEARYIFFNSGVCRLVWGDNINVYVLFCCTYGLWIGKIINVYDFFLQRINLSKLEATPCLSTMLFRNPVKSHSDVIWLSSTQVHSGSPKTRKTTASITCHNGGSSFHTPLDQTPRLSSHFQLCNSLGLLCHSARLCHPGHPHFQNNRRLLF